MSILDKFKRPDPEDGDSYRSYKKVSDRYKKAKAEYERASTSKIRASTSYTMGQQAQQAMGPLDGGVQMAPVEGEYAENARIDRTGERVERLSELCRHLSEQNVIIIETLNFIKKSLLDGYGSLPE
jgi:hypothetical protein